MERIPIKINQVWRNKRSNFQILITGKKENEKWQAKVLTDKPDVFRGTHTMSRWTIWHKFDLITKK